MSKKISMILFAIHLFLGASAAINDKLSKLFILQNNKEQMAKALDQYFGMLSHQLDVPESSKQSFQTKLFEKYFSGMQQEFVTTYAKLFTEPEIDTMIQYNESIIGRKLFTLQDQINAGMSKAYMSMNTIAQEIAQEFKPKTEKKKSTDVIDFEDLIELKRSASENSAAQQLEIFNKEVNAPGLTVVKFSTVWCPPCKLYKPIFEEVAAQCKQLTHNNQVVPVKYIAIDSDQFAEISKQCKIMSIPTTIIYKNGTAVATVSGKLEKNMLVDKLNELAAQ